ncbi:MAG: rhamnulokinase [Acidobacteria bacterium]|nr:rhamnulokinase [Acidobacteriota bacterium]
MARAYLAIDLGAESGRVLHGTLDGGRLSLEDLHRFPNQPVRLPTGLYWDSLRLWHEILQGLANAARRGIAPSGIGVDTWGVDIALLGADGALVDNPRHYRDARNAGMPERLFAEVPRDEVFGQTGIQIMPINSLYQWYAMQRAHSPALRAARTLLFMPDLFNYFLTGVLRAETTIASTSQFYNPATHGWAASLLARLGLDPHLLPNLIPAGSRLGPLLPHVASQTGLDPATPVFAAPGHDTAAAVAAVPAQTEDGWCYISSGTWSLMGVEIPAPVINETTLAMNYTNEVGVGNRIRLLKNIAGLWVLQECRRGWAAHGQDYSYEQLAHMAAGAAPFQAVIQPDAFLDPDSMPARIAGYCRRTNQPPVTAPGDVCRVILESLALRYRQVLENLETITGRSIRVIHIVGGGSRNELLNQLAADATGRTVIAGPAEATAAGNVLVQAMGDGALSGLAQVRSVVRDSFEVRQFDPRPDPRWDEAYRAFLALPN